MTRELFLRLAIFFAIGSLASAAVAHERQGHHAATYEVTAAVAPQESDRVLSLLVVDEESGNPLAARFSMSVGGRPYVSEALGRHGLRFVSIHQGKQQRFVATYARGTGPVEIPLPDQISRGSVTVVKGFEYLPGTAEFVVRDGRAELVVPLKRWSDIQQDGWFAADEHLHYERTHPDHDRDWLTMLDGDGLTHAHFLVLKGGNLPGVWAEQFAYGKAGEGSDGQRLIRPGEEYRDAGQGHINLLGIENVLQPISTGGIGRPAVPYNYPPLLDVFQLTRSAGGIGGPAHGGSLARSSTAVLDTILGGVDFFEIANTHLYETDAWYQLMNCGFIVPPAAGTDLPNFPFRETWQPFLGEVRMYVRLGRERDFESWKQAVLGGEVFVTSGPILRFTVEGVGPGSVVRLPEAGGRVMVTAELASPRPLESLEIVQMGQAMQATVQRTERGGIHRWRIEQSIQIDSSCWLAARGTGAVKTALEGQTGIRQRTLAHTAAVRVLVGDQPIRSSSDVHRLLEQLVRQQEFYREQARYERSEHRQRFLELFDQAIQELSDHR